MRIIVDILHPAHVHFFKCFAREMTEAGHTVVFTARDKDHSVELLRAEGFDPIVLSSHRPGTVALARELLSRTRAFMKIMRSVQPDVLAGIMGPTIALAGRLRSTPSMVFYDTEFAQVTNRWVYPLATSVVTPRAYLDDIGPKQIRYPGYHELAYLHPSRFTPDISKVAASGIDTGRPYVFFRFVAFEASHDTHEQGLSTEARIALIREVAHDHQVVISSERALPKELAPYAYRGKLDDVHHFLAFARMTVGESATMASESAVLGTPSAYIATTDRGYIREQQDRYGLVRIFGDGEADAFVQHVVSGLADPTLDERAAEGHAKLLAETIDVTGFMRQLFEERFGS